MAHCGAGYSGWKKRDGCGAAVAIDLGILPLSFLFGLNCLSCIFPFAPTDDLHPWVFVIAPCTRACVCRGGHFSCLPLSIVAILRAREAWHWISFILPPNCFQCEHYCKAICVQHKAKTQRPRERHLVSFVSLDLLVASVIDFWLCRGGTNEQRVEFFFPLIPSSARRRLSVDPV